LVPDDTSQNGSGQIRNGLEESGEAVGSTNFFDAKKIGLKSMLLNFVSFLVDTSVKQAPVFLAGNQGILKGEVSLYH
jgi:hypothetical protein